MIYKLSFFSIQKSQLSTTLVMKHAVCVFMNASAFLILAVLQIIQQNLLNLFEILYTYST